jgi:hypothetical protein
MASEPFPGLNRKVDISSVHVRPNAKMLLFLAGRATEPYLSWDGTAVSQNHSTVHQEGAGQSNALAQALSIAKVPSTMTPTSEIWTSYVSAC